MYLICSMFVISSIIWSLGREKWMFKSSCRLFNLKFYKRMHWTQMDYNINLRTIFTLKAKSLYGSNIAITWRCTLLLNAIERCCILKTIATNRYSILYWFLFSSSAYANLKIAPTKMYSILYNYSFPFVSISM